MFTKENLNDLYCVKGLTMEKIATQNNCTSGTVLYWVHKFGLPIKKREDYALPYHKRNIEKKDIIRFYYVEHLSTNNALPYAYNGFKADLIVGNRVPDFYNNNGEKKIVEVFGQVFHNPKLFLKAFKRQLPLAKTYDRTITDYAKLGFECIIFWEDELLSPDAEKIVLQKLTGGV